MAASPYCLYALAFILIRSASALIGALSAQQAILPELQNLPTASVALASAAPIRRIFSPSALAASTVLVLQDNRAGHQVGKEIFSCHQEKSVFTSVPRQSSAPCSLPLQQGVSPGLQLRMCNHYNIGKTLSSENQIAMFDFQLVTHSLQTMNSLLAPMSCFSRHNSQIRVLLHSPQEL